MTSTAITSFISGLAIFHGNRAGAAHEARLKELNKMLHPEVRPDARPEAGLELSETITQLGTTHRIAQPAGRLTLSFTTELLGVHDDVLQRIRDAREVHLNICSPGGDMRCTETILAALEGKRVMTSITGYCASSAALLAVLAPGHRRIHADASLMLHGPAACAMGDAHHLRQIADWLELGEHEWIDRLVARTRQDRELVTSWFSGADHRFTAEQALAAGLVDTILVA